MWRCSARLLRDSGAEPELMFSRQAAPVAGRPPGAIPAADHLLHLHGANADQVATAARHDNLPRAVNEKAAWQRLIAQHAAPEGPARVGADSGDAPPALASIAGGGAEDGKKGVARHRQRHRIGIRTVSERQVELIGLEPADRSRAIAPSLARVGRRGRIPASQRLDDLRGVGTRQWAAKAAQGDEAGVVPGRRDAGQKQPCRSPLRPPVPVLQGIHAPRGRVLGLRWLRLQLLRVTT